MIQPLRSALIVVAVSLLVAGAFSTTQALTISEIMYNPGRDGVEFIEIYNEDGEARDLSHYYFTQGLTFEFPGFEEGSSTYLRGKSFLVVAKDVGKMLALYPYLRSDNPHFPALVGPYSGSLKHPGSLRVALANPGGAIDVAVHFNDHGAWPSVPDGTGHSLVLRNPDLDDPNNNDNWTWSPLMGGSPGLANFGDTVFTTTSFIETAESWKLFRGKSEASEPRDAWRQPGFDASAWEEGTTPIGTGDPCFAGGLALDDMTGNYVSVFFRKTFEVPDLAAVDVLILRLSLDDGFIAYLNGKEVGRKNMAPGKDTFDATATATSKCTSKIEINIPDPGSKLVQGTNVLAVQVHNRSLADKDFGFIPELIAKNGKSVGTAPTIDVRLNEFLWNTAQAEGPWLEIFNNQDVEQDISGFFLSNDPADLRKFVFEPGTVIAPHGFLVLDGTQVQPSGVQLVPTDQTSSFLLLSRTLADQPPEKSLQVVDANRFKLGPSIAPVEMSIARFPDGGQNWVIARTPTKGAPNQFKVEKNVVLNEIMYRPYYPLGANWVPGTNGFLRAEDQGEYVEIYNRGSSPVNIGGWALTKGVQFEFPSGTTLPAGGYLVVARDPDYMSNYYGLPAAQVFGPWHGATVNEAVTLSGRDKKVELSDEIGNPVDGVHYFDGKSRWSKWADGRGSSLERIDPMEDGSQEGNWDASDESSKSEWKHYSWTGRYIESEKDFTIILLTRGIVLLDNLSVTDPSNPSAGNYIKNGDFEQPLKAPWTIDGSHIHSGRITYDRKDGEACLKIIATGRGNNRIDCIRYLAPQFPRNKDLLVEFDAKWITGYGILQFSGTWNTFAHSFHIEIPQKLGSPGRENSVHARLPSGNQGPLIQQVRQQPVLPGAGQDVVVTAEVSDPDGVKEVKLRYSVESVIAPANEVLMLDDGKGKDARAKDGVYTAVIPGQAMGQRVLFAIKAYDAPGNAGRFPYDDRTRTHSYLLDPGAADESQLRYAAYIHATLGAQGGVPDYRLVMSQENTQYLLSRHVMNNDLIDGSLIWNESKVFYNVGMRFGNSPWTRTASVGTSYKVKLNRDEVLQGNRKFKLFNQGNQINERADYYLHRSANVPGRDPLPFERETYVRPYLNAQAAGLFEREETPDKDFIRRWYPNDDLGVLYKLDDKFLVNLPAGTRRDNRDAFIQYHGDDPEQYRWWFLPRTRDKYDDFSALIDLAKFFTQAKGDDYNSQICKHINLEEVIRTLAVEINCDDWDTWGTTRGKNSYIYHPPIDGRWNLIPWDKNLTFGNPSSLPLVPPMFPETVKLLSSPPGKRMYTVVLNDMLKRFYRADYLNQYFNEQAKDKGGAPIPGVPSSAGGIASFITSRTGMMRSAVPPKELAFAVTTGAPDGVVNASEASLVIEGDAPLTLWHVTISGSIPTWLDPQGKAPALDFDVNDGSLAWTTTTHWKTAAAVPVVNGINILDLVALDQDAIVIGSAQLVVTYNLNWSAPQVTSVEPSQGSVAGGTPVTIHGSGIHVGARVFFATALAALNSLDEAGGTVSVTSPPGTLGPVDVKVVNLDGQSALLAGGFTYLSTSFNRGDVNSSRTINLTDAILILRYSFGSQALPCLDAADVNDDGTINITDPIVLLNYLFLGGGPPAAPFDPTGATFGPDPTPDALGCNLGT